MYQIDIYMSSEKHTSGGMIMKRQRFRKLLLIVSMLIFPITLYYLSPVVIITGAVNGVVNGSFIIFLTLLIGSMFFGRLFCAYLCPAGGIQECTMLVNDKMPKRGWRDNIKYVIWGVWITTIIACFVFIKHKLSVDFFFMTDHGISVANIYGYIIYYIVVAILLIPSLIFGRRAVCHYFCWMAPFMVIGGKLGDICGAKIFKLSVDKDACINCHLCDKNCPMSINVSEKVKSGNMYDNECILCGACVDNCPKKAIKYKVK